MNYYIWSQGTKSQDFSFLNKNGQTIHSDDNERRSIHDLFRKVEVEGIEISKNNSNTKIIKYHKYFLFEVFTINTDRLERKIPVQLLIENYSKSYFSKRKLIDILTILRKETILVDEDNWKNILYQLEHDLNDFQRKKRLIIALVTIMVIIVIFTILKYYFQ